MKNKIIISIVLLVITTLIITLIINRDISMFKKNANLSDIEFNNKVNIYVFWGEGCPHCEDLFTYLESIRKDYNKLFNVYGFEIFENESNKKLMDKFKEELGSTTGRYSVPYIIIGDEVVEGFVPNMGEKILDLIKSEYNDLDNVNKFNKIFE